MAATAATTNAELVASATANGASLPANVLGPSRRTGPRRTTRAYRGIPTAAAINVESNENSNNNSRVIEVTGPRRNYPNLVPVALPGVVKAPATLTSLAPRHKGPVGYPNRPAPPPLNMPRPKKTGIRSLLTGKYRRTTRRRRST